MTQTNYKSWFPLLINQPNLVYLDSAATCQKPRQVVEAITEAYSKTNAPIQRGVYKLAESATEKYEAVRARVARKIGASPDEIVFAKSATEAFNTIAQGLKALLKPGDAIILSELEHHANFLPWLKLAEEKNLEIRIWKVQDHTGELTNLENLLDEKVKVLAITRLSNTLGNYTPLAKIVSLAHQNNTLVVVDAVQSFAAEGFEIAKIPADFVVASGHKIFAGNGSGFWYGRKELLETMQPLLWGGGMIKNLTTNWQIETLESPGKFEAGSPDYAAVCGLDAALNFLESLPANAITEHQQKLRSEVVARISKLKGVELFGPLDSEQAGGILSFKIKGVHDHDIASILAQNEVCIRAGQHCTFPLMRRLGISSTSRISLQIYNSLEDIERLLTALQNVYRIFQI